MSYLVFSFVLFFFFEACISGAQVVSRILGREALEQKEMVGVRSVSRKAVDLDAILGHIPAS